MALNISKTPAIALLPNNDMMLFVNDFAKHAISAMTIKEIDTGSAVLSSVAVLADYRMVMWGRSHTTGIVEPLRILPMIDNAAMTGSTIVPLYEAINPQIQKANNSSTVVMTFWTNFQSAVTEYTAAEVIKFKQSEIGDVGAVPDSAFRALCATTIYFKRYYISGGEVATKLGEVPVTTPRWDLVPVASKPVILQIFKEDYPIVDFGGAGSGTGTGSFRLHDHRDNYNGGMAFAIYHPGTGVPQLPWEV